MTGWLIVAGYLAGWTVTARRAALWLSQLFDDRDATDRLLSRSLGFLLGAPWPLVLLGMVMFWHAPKTEAELRAEVDRLTAERRGAHRSHARA